MKFESQQKRNLWMAYGIRWLIEYLVIYILLKLLASDYDKGDKWGDAFIGLLILWGVELALLLKNALLAVVIYKWKGKAEVADQLFDAFRKYKLPKPSDYYSDAEGYIGDVMGNEEASQEAKNFASIIAGVMATYQSNHMIVRGMLYQFSLEEAIKRYQASFPPEY